MRRSTATIGSAAYFALEAGTFAILLPWLITGRQFHRLWPVPAQVAGVLLIGAGLMPVAGAFVQFARAGGTPLPLAPTQHLVVAGFHRYVRNPIYLGSLLIFAGEALLFGRLSLLVYAAPALARRFGAEYEAYRRAVPAWWPRLHPWTPGDRGVPGHPPAELR